MCYKSAFQLWFLALDLDMGWDPSSVVCNLCDLGQVTYPVLALAYLMHEVSYHTDSKGRHEED